MKKTLLDEFISYVRQEHGIVIEALTTGPSDSFEKIFGCSFLTSGIEKIESYSLDEVPMDEDRVSQYESTYNENFSYAA